MRHAQPTRLRTRPGPAGRLTHSPARRGEAEQRRRLRRRCSGGARAGYGAAPRASRVLRIALRGDTRLRRALDPRASATPQAANGAGPACPDPNADTPRSATRSTSLQPKSPRFEGIDASTPCLHFHNQMNASSGTRLRDNQSPRMGPEVVGHQLCGYPSRRRRRRSDQRQGFMSFSRRVPRLRCRWFANLAAAGASITAIITELHTILPIVLG